MNPARLLEHFDRIAEAPDAIPRLRRFILDLAVRGKLVEQDPSDEPASELLKRIEAKKIALVKAGIIKKTKAMPPIGDEELIFDVPAKWEWVRLNDITSYIQRGKSPQYAIANGLPVISQKCVQWSGLNLAAAKFITPESIASYEEVRFLQDGDLLWNSTGTGTIGRVIKLISPPSKLVCDSHVTVVRCLSVDAEYIRSWLRSDHVYGIIEERAAGSTNQVELTAQMALSQVVPLPPLAEQHRIVAKVDELMALCDRLEASQAKRESRRDRLASASLKRTSQPEDVGNGEEFRENVRFHLNHLPRLTTRLEHIKELRQTILNLAVRGKLVPQDPNDEPASELIKRIKCRKHSLTRKAKATEQSDFHASLNARAPYQLPSSWAWTAVSDVADSRLGKMLDKAKNKGTLRRYLRNVNVRWFDFDLSDIYEMHIEDHEMAELSLNNGDVLICEGGEPGRCAVWDEREAGIVFQKAIHRVRFQGMINPEYFARALSHDAASGRLGKYFTGVGIKHFTGRGLSSYTFPLPPLAEQHRIVAKVNELMALCDQLEAQLAAPQADRSRLLEATLCEALGTSNMPTPRANRAANPRSTPAPRQAERPLQAAKPRLVEPAHTAPQRSVADQPKPAPDSMPQSAPEAILAQMKPGHHYSRAQLCDALGLSVYEWNMAIRVLKDNGTVIQTGEKRGARYRLI